MRGEYLEKTFLFQFWFLEKKVYVYLMLIASVYVLYSWFCK